MQHYLFSFKLLWVDMRISQIAIETFRREESYQKGEAAAKTDNSQYLTASTFHGLFYCSIYGTSAAFISENISLYVAFNLLRWDEKEGKKQEQLCLSIVIFALHDLACFVFLFWLSLIGQGLHFDSLGC